MAPVYKVRGPGDIPTDTFTDITDYFRLYTLDVTSNAEEGSQAQSTVQADDPLGEFDIVGQRQFRVEESTATGSNVVLYVGYTADRDISRGDYRADASRVWDIQLVDINTVLSRRVMNGSDANRPAETDVARVQWLEATNEGSLIDDTRFIHTNDPVSMDAVDYRGQRFNEVLDDCAQQSGKNYFLAYMGDTDEFTLWYGFASSSNYTSPLRLTNDLTEVDDTWTFAISNDTKLKRDPSRVNSGAYLPYAGGTVYQQRAATYNSFSQRDAILPAENVKTATKAAARATRYLSEMSTEEDVITTTVILPAAKVNFLMQGMRVQFRAVHLPGYTGYAWVRVLNRSVSQVSEQEDRMYAVKMDLSAGDPPIPAPPLSDAFAILYLPDNNISPVGSVYPDVLFGGTGDSPPGGYPYVAKQGSLTYKYDSPVRSATYPFIGIQSDGTGTLAVEFIGSAAHAVTGDVTTTCGLYKNGVLVTSDVQSSSGGLRYIGYSFTINEDVAVVPGDVLSVDISTSWSGGITVPSGAGDLANHLQVQGALA